MSALEEWHGLARFRPLQLLALAGLFVALGVICFELKFSVLDLDIWWHLKVGDWIVQHAAFPHTGILSRTAAGRPWAAYSWGYEVLLSRAYAWFGLLGIGIYGTLLTLLVALSVYCMVRRISRRFWIAFILAIASCCGFLLNMMPRPVFFSIAFFCITLTIIFEAQRAARLQSLYWLPLVFLLWANFHIQFVYGLAVVGLLLFSNVVQRVASFFPTVAEYVEEPTFPTGRLVAILLACVIATLLSPYSYHLYEVVWSYSHSRLIYSMIQELQPLSFRAYSNYVELLLAAAAFFAVGRQKKVDLFQLTLLALASIVAFRTMRDSWFLCTSAAACIASVCSLSTEADAPDTMWEMGGVFAVVAILLVLFARGTDFTTRGLDAAVSNMFPVNAVNFVRQNQIPGPLYNTFDWGGFLTWYMPDYPVVLDGRTDLYGDDLTKLLLDTQNGDVSYKDNPYLNEAGVVVLHRRDGLVAALTLDPRFRKVFEDQLATVFARQ